ncbi:carboxypeptidase regulatory-like domain-containing protein [Ectothiorhodospiraceae bacterium BW-2]|nr:carboxypeptidase regulatory-like domain-containing protein [Ectothiorhodospiraceae bacterium BW-2]
MSTLRAILSLLLILSTSTAFSGQTLTLNNGWNLVSLYSEAEEGRATVAETFAIDGIERIFAFIDGRWQFYDATSNTGSLGAEPLTHLLNRGVWIKTSLSSDAPPIELTLTGPSHSLDPNTLSSGWNLIGLGSGLNDIDSFNQQMALYPIRPQRLFAFSNGSWQFRDLTSHSGSLTDLDPHHGLWLYLNTALTLTQNNQTTSRIDLGDDLYGYLFAEGTPRDTPQPLTLRHNNTDYPLTVPQADNYTLQLHDPYGSDYAPLTLSGDTDLSDHLAQTERLRPTRLYVYGLPDQNNPATLLQEVELYQNGTLLGTLTDPVTGFELPPLSASTELTLKKSGYLDTLLETTDQPTLYAVMQPATYQSGQLLQNQRLNDDYTATRPLEASAPLAVPNNGNHQLGAVLLHRSGRDNPNRSLSIRLTPYQSQSAIPDLEQLQSAAAQDFLTEQNLTELPERWHWQVIAGSQLDIIDISRETRLTLSERSADSLGAYATIDPYQSQLLQGDLNNYRALLEELRDSRDYPTSIDLYVRTASGWQKASEGVRIIDPLTGYDNQESYAVKGQLPLNRPLITSATPGSLMSQQNSGGLYDYAFVLKQNAPIQRDLTLTLIDAQGQPLPNALIALDWTRWGLTDTNGQYTFTNLTLPLDRTALNFEAIHTSTARTPLTLSINDLVDTPAPSATLALNDTLNRPLNRLLESQQLTLTGSIVDSQSGSPIVGARVRLQAPAALANLHYHQGTFSAYQLHQANYTWQIRIRPGTTSRLLRLLDNQWRTLKQASGSQNGHRLTQSELLQELIIASDDQDPNAPFTLVGDFDLSLTVEHDLDQNGTIDYTETATNMGVSIALNETYLTLNGSATADERYQLNGGPDQGFFLLKRLDANAPAADALWQLRLGETTLSLNTQPTPMISWKQLLQHLSDPTTLANLITSGAIEGSDLALTATLNGTDYSQPLRLAAPYADEPLSILTLQNGSATPGQGLPERIARTDERGRYQFNDINPAFNGDSFASLTLEASHPSYQPHPQPSCPPLRAPPSTRPSTSPPSRLAMSPSASTSATPPPPPTPPSA